MNIKKIVSLLKEKNMSITTMESCTGGLIISSITDIEGASSITEGGYVTYSNQAKIDAGVRTETIEDFGVYSSETAFEMATVCRTLKKANIGIGVTGTFNNLDSSNNDSEKGKVYYSIDINPYLINGEISVPKMDRKLQKEYVRDIILKEVFQWLEKN